MRDVSFLPSDSRCQQYVSDLSNVTSKLREGQGFVGEIDFHLTFSFLVFKVEGCLHHSCSAEL